MSVPPRQNPFPAGLGYDPAKPTPSNESVTLNKNIDLPQAAYKLEGGVSDSKKYSGMEAALPERPGLNDTGREINVKVNQFKVQKYPQKDVYQYDINIGNGAEKRGLIKAIWESNTLQARLKSFSNFWLWNGDKIAWCDVIIPRQEDRFTVDLDAEKGRTPRPGHEDDNKHKVIIKQTKVVRLAVIGGYLSRKMQFDNSVLEAITFLDHLIRHNPKAHYTALKRSYFVRTGTRYPLDEAIEGLKGVYSSLRLCDLKPSVGSGTGVALNIDVANGVFWTAQQFSQAARNFLSANNQRRDWSVMRRILLPIANRNSDGYTFSDDFKELRKMHKLQFMVTHRGLNDTAKYTVKRFTFPKIERDTKHHYMQEGQNARNTYFDFKKPDGATVKVSVEEYMLKKFNVHLEHPYLPLIETERAGAFPMEVCKIVGNQPYKFKLNPRQTQAMIKFAVTRPKERIAAIDQGVGLLKWSQDPYMKHYGLNIDPTMTVTKARLLPNPEVGFKNSKVNPGTFGSWDLKSKVFLTPNSQPLQCWGFAILAGCLSTGDVQEFARAFIQAYVAHGGVVVNKQPVIYSQSNGEDIGKLSYNFRNVVGSQHKRNPQLLFFIMKERNSITYERIKKNMECRFVNFSQVLNSAHVQRKNPQYLSNVALKVNAKLGGSNMRAMDSGDRAYFPPGSMFIGADVSHPSPGSPQGSMAAMTMSMDKPACRYAAAVQINGTRLEMISQNNIQAMIIPMFKHWMNTVGVQSNGARQGPSTIFYFRDGVSEGQYQHVLDQEVQSMKKVLVAAFGNVCNSIKWVVTVCSKRHHIRLFPAGPRDGDKNLNALPGTLVERDVTHPFEYDFYLNSHKAIQGTARPVHYHVLLDDTKSAPNAFQKMVYLMCYQYQRSTTSVSLFPAVYYAHLASNRARAHEDAPHSAGPRGGQKFVEENNQRIAAQAVGLPFKAGSGSGSYTQLGDELRPLIPLGASNINEEERQRLRTGMWYI